MAAGSCRNKCSIIWFAYLNLTAAPASAAAVVVYSFVEIESVLNTLKLTRARTRISSTGSKHTHVIIIIQIDLKILFYTLSQDIWIFLNVLSR